MKSDDHVINILEKAAGVLTPFLDRVVFTGGVIVPLYLDLYKDEFRPTEDVDCVIDIVGRVAYSNLERELRALGLKNDISSNIICRWQCDDIRIDVMPVDDSILGFTNSWYKEGLRNSVSHTLPSGKDILIFKIEYLLASKIEAFTSRGGNDILMSKDMEDIVMLCAFSSQIRNCLIADVDVRAFLAKEMHILLDRPGFHEDISGFFLPDMKGREKVKHAVDIINKIIIAGRM